jgi:hypothetical protein
MSSLFAKAKEKCPGLEEKALAAKERAMGLAGPLASKIPGVGSKRSVTGPSATSATNPQPQYPQITGEPLGGPYTAQVAPGAASETASYPDQNQQPPPAAAGTTGRPSSFSDKLKAYGEKAKGAKELAKIYATGCKTSLGKTPAS